MGGDQELADAVTSGDILKSTPPVWAGTDVLRRREQLFNLKSTPPVWAGTLYEQWKKG